MPEPANAFSPPPQYKDGAGRLIGALQWDGTNNDAIKAATLGRANADDRNVMGVQQQNLRLHCAVGDWICVDGAQEIPRIFLLSDSQMRASYTLANGQPIP